MYRGQLADRPLSEEHLLALLDAARWAPSGHNSQPCEFAVIDDRALIGRIAEIATDNFDAFLASDAQLPRWASNFRRWLRSSREELARCGDGIYFKRMLRPEWQTIDSLDDAALRELMIGMFGSNGESSKLIRSAPCLLLTLVNTTREAPDRSQELLALTTAGAAMQNIRLAARELGVAVHEQSLLYDLPETRRAIRALLGIPPHYRIVGGMRVGYRTKPVRTAFTHVRRSVGDITHRNGFAGPSPAGEPVVEEHSGDDRP